MSTLDMVTTEVVYAPHQLYDPRLCYKPRRLSSYVYTPRSKHPPGWQQAQRFVKALVVSRIGQRPYFYLHGLSYWESVNRSRRYQAVYARLRSQYEAEDFPINP